MKSDKPKALMPLVGKSFISHILDTIKETNIQKTPIIVVGYKKEDIFKHLENEKVIYAEQKEQLGTGHAVMAARESIENDTETVFVLSTDQPMVSKETIENILEKHQNSNATVTIGTVVLPDFKDWRSGLLHFGRIIRDKTGSVIKNTEYKDASEDERKIKEVNPAIYAFKNNWLWQNIDNLKNENVQGEYYLTDLIKTAKEQGEKVEALPIKNNIEAIQPNTQEGIQVLEKLISRD